jgi:hypothetical protein
MKIARWRRHLAGVRREAAEMFYAGFAGTPAGTPAPLIFRNGGCRRPAIEEPI